MTGLKKYSLEEIGLQLEMGNFPFSGITELGTTEFHFVEPSSYLGVVLHSGNRVRPDILEIMEVNSKERFREEDPYMDRFIRNFPMQLIARDSRFEYDLNWEKDYAIYEYGKKKWGLQVWKRPLTQEEVETTLRKYHEFHSLLDIVISHMLKNSSTVLLFDMHSFSYQRNERKNWWEDKKPELNLGTRSVNRRLFAPQIDLFLKSISGSTLDGHPLRIAENELFPGGYLTHKMALAYDEKVLVFAIEYKKIFMDEWTGELYKDKIDTLIRDFLLTKDRMISKKY